jgi:hypothetical protein
MRRRPYPLPLFEQEMAASAKQIQEHNEAAAALDDTHRKLCDKVNKVCPYAPTPPPCSLSLGRARRRQLLKESVGAAKELSGA